MGFEASTESGVEGAPASPRLIDRRKLALLGLGVAAAFIAYLLARPVMNESAARVIGILVLAAIFWATEALPLFATAFLIIGLEIITLASDGGLADYWTRFLQWLGMRMESSDRAALSASEFIAPWASDIIMLFMGGFLLSAAITKHGIDRAVASRVLQPFTRSPLLLVFGVLGLTAFMSMWMSNTATAAMMMAMVGVVVVTLPKDQARFKRAVYLAVPFGANIGGVGTPIGTPPNAIAFGALNAAGYEATFLKWMTFMVPIEIVMLAITGFIIYFFFKPEPGLVIPKIESGEKLSREGVITLLVLALAIILWLTSGVHGVKPGIVALLAAAALTVFGILDRRDVDSIDWNILILMWGGLSLGVAMRVSGLMDLIGSANLAEIPGGSWGIALTVTVVGVTLSTFVSNTATAALLVPTALALSVPGKQQFAVLAAVACSFAMAMPVSTPPNVIAYATGQVPSQSMAKVGLLVGIFAVVAMMVLYQVYNALYPVISKGRVRKKPALRNLLYTGPGR
jgi:sodium-dependent dicarboxylate transporter 2/3/5